MSISRTCYIVIFLFSYSIGKSATVYFNKKRQHQQTDLDVTVKSYSNEVVMSSFSPKEINKRHKCLVEHFPVICVLCQLSFFITIMSIYLLCYVYFQILINKFNNKIGYNIVPNIFVEFRVSTAVVWGVNLVIPKRIIC